MFIGHHAVAFAAKKAVPKVSLGTLFLSVQFLDLLWPTFLLLGIEHVRISPGNTAFTPMDFYDYPLSHGLVTALGWSVFLAVLYYYVRHYTKGAWVIGIGVFSHWILDFVTHRPDMPISPGMDIYVGLGLWNSPVATVLVEGTMFIAGVIMYAKFTTAIDRTGTFAFWSLVAFLILAYVASILSPPPPSEFALGIGGQASWLFVVWGYWIDKHRQVRTAKISI